MAESGEDVTSVKHLAELTNADVVLLGMLLSRMSIQRPRQANTTCKIARLMKHLASMGTLYEGETAGTYSLTPLSKALSQHKKFQEAIPLRSVSYFLSEVCFSVHQTPLILNFTQQLQRHRPSLRRAARVPSEDLLQESTRRSLQSPLRQRY